MKKFFYGIVIILSSYSYAQSDMYVAAELEGGILKTDYNIPTTVKNSLIDKEKLNYAIKGSVSFIMDWNELSTEVGIGQGLRLWSLEGVGENKNIFKLKHEQTFPSAFVGGYYRFPITDGIVNLNLYLGGRFTADFVNYNALNSKIGDGKDYVLAYTEPSDKVNFNIVPEIGIKGYFQSENFWQLGIRYNQPLNGDIIRGELKHIVRGVPVETTTYSVGGQTISLVFKYGFKLYK